MRINHETNYNYFINLYFSDFNIIYFYIDIYCNIEEVEYIDIIDDKKNDAIIKFLLYPSSGGYDETYYFEISNDGIMNSYFGSRKDDNVKAPQFMNMEKILVYEEKQLTQDELQIIIGFATELQESGYEKDPERVVYDTWISVLLYENQVFEMYCWENKNGSEILGKLTDVFIELSPIPVNLRGFA